MERALELAARGRCGASPNPMVGAVVVTSDGRLVGEGFHARYGGPHAEVEALAVAGASARGGTLVVTLEPCSHHGKTPPCTEAILEAGVRRVVIAMRDPNTEAGGGLERLRGAGLEVVLGPCEGAARKLNRRWLRWASQHRPWVTLKAAATLDGRIATRTGHSRWISGEAARTRSLELREEHDAILVGAGTVAEDDPRLTRRLGLNPCRHWLRVVLDSRLRTPESSNIVRESPETTLLVHTAEAPSACRRRLAKAGVRLLEVEDDGRGRVAVGPLLRRLAAEPIAALLVEGGGEVHGSFIDCEAVDEAVVFLAPTIVGGKDARPVVAGLGCATLDGALRLRFESANRCGEDLEIRAVRAEESDVHRDG